MQWRLKSPASRLFTQLFIHTQIKENIKAPRHWPLCGEFTVTGEFPTQMASNAEKVSIDDVIMQINLNLTVIREEHMHQTTTKQHTNMPIVCTRPEHKDG